MKSTLLYIIGVFATVLFTACEHKELYRNEMNVDVVFDWRYSPEANPERMSLYLFPKGENEGWRYDFSNIKGGTICLPHGTYDVLCFNSDSEKSMYRITNSWETLEVSTHETTLFASRSSSIPRAEGTSGERIVWDPDSLWHDSVSDFVIDPTNKNNRITLLPENVVQTCIVKVRNVKNLSSGMRFVGSITSMVGGVHPADKTFSDEKVTIPFDFVAHEEENLIISTFQTYGHCADNERVHQLIIYVLMENGEKFFYTFDVTEQLHEATETGILEIVLDNLPLPTPIANGNGFSPGLEDWESVDIDITM